MSQFAFASRHLSSQSLRLAAASAIETLEPRRLLAGSPVYLSDLPWTKAASPYLPARVDLSVDAKPIQIGGVTYSKGIGVHSASELTYELGGAYTRFTAAVGIDDAVGNGPADGSSQFLIYADGVLKFTSSRRDGSQPAELIDVDVTGVKTLKLVTNTGGRPTDNDYKDHTDWADARLEAGEVTSRPSVYLTNAAPTLNEASRETVALFVVHRTGSLDEPLTVNFGLNGSATVNGDYIYSPTGVFTFAAGASEVSFYAAAKDDAIVEGDEAITLTLLPASGYDITGGSKTATIIDDDTPPPATGESVYLSDLNWTKAVSPWVAAAKDKSVSGNSLKIGGTSYARGVGVHSASELTYNLDGKYTRFTAAVGIDDAVGNGSGDGSSQFRVYADGVLKFTSSRRDGSQAAELIDVDITGTKTLRLVTNTGGLAGDNDYKDHADWADAKLFSGPVVQKPIVSVSILGTDRLQENGDSSVAIVVSRTGPTDEALSVGYTTGGTAMGWNDYIIIWPSSFEIPANAESATYRIFGRPNSRIEGDKSIILELSPGNDYEIGGGRVTVTLVDDDVPPPLPVVTLTVVDGVSAETRTGEPANTATVVVTRTGDLSQPLELEWGKVSGSGDNADWDDINIAPVSHFAIPAGQASIELTFSPVDDDRIEPTEIFAYKLYPISGRYTIGGQDTASILIVDNDSPTPPVEQSVYLSDLNWVKATSPYLAAAKDKSVSGNGMKIGGVSYAKGVGVHSASELLYTLDGSYTRFTAAVGIDDSVGNGSGDGSSQFMVYADGVLKFTSTRRDGSQAAELIDVDITGAKTLRLVTNTGGRAGDNDYRDHADWADAKLFSSKVIVPPVETGQPLRVMLVGDSITEGEKGHASFRYWLDKSFDAAGMNVDLVGTRTGVHNSGVGGATVSPLYPDFDQDHQSEWGAKLEDVAAYPTPPADIALVYIGHNDIRGGESPRDMANELTAYVHQLRAVNPKVKIGLVLPIKNTSLGYVAEMHAYRTQIWSVAESTSSATSPVIVVNAYSDFDPQTMTYDTVHPNEVGEKFIAAKYFDAIERLRGIGE